MSKKLPASTLIEVLIALVIIMAVFITASKIYVNVFMSAPSYQNMSIKKQLLDQLNKCIENPNEVTEHSIIEGIEYQTTVKQAGYSDSLSIVEVKAFNQEKLVGAIKGLTKKQAQ